MKTCSIASDSGRIEIHRVHGPPVTASVTCGPRPSTSRSTPVSEHEEDFAAMFEASEKARRFERGQMVEGSIVGIGTEVAFVSIGGKSEAQIDVAELKDENGAFDVSVGDRIQAKIVSTSGGIMLSRRGVRNAATQRELEEAFSAGIGVEGRVERAVKGGYEVRIARERAFCPLSQIDIVRTADPAV